jgi:hypothetical protein
MPRKGPSPVPGCRSVGKALYYSAAPQTLVEGVWHTRFAHMEIGSSGSYALPETVDRRSENIWQHGEEMVSLSRRMVNFTIGRGY